MKYSQFIKATAIASALFATFATNANEVLKIGSEATFPPFEFIGADGVPTGFDIELITALAQKAGYEVEINNMGFDSLVPALITSQIDVAIAGMTITEERAKKVAFTTPYYKSTLSILINKNDKDTIKSKDDLKGKKLCAQIGTTGAMTAEELSPGNVATYNGAPEAFMELKIGSCSAIVNDRPVNLYFLAKETSDQILELNDRIGDDSYGIAVNKNNTELLDKLNKAFADYKASGEFTALHKKWFGVADE